MPRLRLAMAQINPTVGDFPANERLITRDIERARAEGADLVAFPELAICGYPPEDLVLRPSFVTDNLAVLARLAGFTRGISAVVGFVDRQGGALYNAAALLADGAVQGVYHKHVLPNYGVFDERRYFQAGTGLLVSRIGEITFGVTICEDLWQEDGPHVATAAAGASVIVNINASPYHQAKGHTRQELLARRAGQCQASFAYVNQVGGQDSLVFDGQSCLVDAAGRLIARAPQFVETLELVDLPGGGRVAPEMEPLEEVYAALILGLRDYLGKNGFRGVVLGLSGGIDSSLTAAISVDALGPEHVLGVLMPSPYTSSESTELAEKLAANLGMRTVTLSIADPFQAMLKTLEPVFAGTQPGLAEETLQARNRGALLMAISNKTGCMVLSTGNKSETSTGYSTLYGDMAGGLAVLLDVPKTLVFELSRWRNARGDGEVIPRAVIDRPPTAELRANQLDSDSLPPYAILDPILSAYVEEDLAPEQIVALGYPPDVVAKVVGMVDGAEYKRRQAPPGIKITRRAFGRDRRPPITNHYRQARP